MSDPDKADSDVSGGGYGGDGNVRKKQSDHGCEGNFGKGKKAAIFRFRKGKNQVQRTKKKRNFSGILGCLEKRVRGGGGGGCFSCLKRPQTLDIAGESPTSDPNSPKFTHGMLRALIENNDFYFKDCNTH